MFFFFILITLSTRSAWQKAKPVNVGNGKTKIRKIVKETERDFDLCGQTNMKLFLEVLTGQKEWHSHDVSVCELGNCDAARFWRIIQEEKKKANKITMRYSVTKRDFLF